MGTSKADPVFEVFGHLPTLLPVNGLIGQASFLLNERDCSLKYLQEALEQIKIRTKKEIASIIIGMILQLTSYRTMFLSLALTSCISLCYSQCVLSKRRVVRNANL